jgi:hypothetical protein
MQALLTAMRRLLRWLQPIGGAPIAEGGIDARDIAIPVAATLLVIVTMAESFVKNVVPADPSWANATPLELYVIAVASALGAS